MFDPELFQAIKERKTYHGKLELPSYNYPSWNQMIPYWDKSILRGNKRAENPLKIFANMDINDFPIIGMVKRDVYDKLDDVRSFSCHCYAGITPNAFASPVHRDPMDVLFVVMQGTIPWRMFENGYNPNSENNKSTFSKALIQGDYVYVPKGTWHAAFPNQSRIAFSFGWDWVPKIG